MCVFAIPDYHCLLQKISRKNYDFEMVEYPLWKKLHDSFERAHDGLYACYKYWFPRDPAGSDDAAAQGALHELVYNVKTPRDRGEHYSERRTADDSRCWAKGPKDKNGKREVKLPKQRIAANCPKYNKAYLCEPRGNAYPDVNCPLLRDHNFKLEYGFNSVIRDVVSQREVAFKVRTISGRQIGCDTAYLVGLKLTRKQRVLWYLKMLGPRIVTLEEVEHISGIHRKDFHHHLYGSPRKDGFREGGAVSKVERILRHAGLADPVIQAFTQEAFKLSILKWKHPLWYRESRGKQRLILRKAYGDFPVWVAESDIEDFWGYQHITHRDVQQEVKAGRSILLEAQYKKEVEGASGDDEEWEDGLENTRGDPLKTAEMATDDPT